MDELKKTLDKIFEEGPEYITLSSPAGTKKEWIRARLGRTVVSNREAFQLEKLTQTQAFHENMGESEAKDRVFALFSESFKQMNAGTGTAEYSVKKSKSGKYFALRKEKTGAQPAGGQPGKAAAHNREKVYILKEGEDIPILRELGVLTAEGRVAAGMYDKYRQVNRFAELIDDVVSRDGRKLWRIVDFGCGKSYLTFVLYHYLTVVRGVEAEITGLDLKEKVIEKCRDLAERHGCGGMSFICGDIRDFAPGTPPDMVIALHACDEATDYALERAVSWGADYIFAAPCCQHELNAGMIAERLRAVASYGVLKERLAALVTDAVRAKALEYRGYDVTAPEFVDISHSPKNVLIRAVKKPGGSSEERRSRIEKEVYDVAGEMGYTPLAVKLLMQPRKE